jgi:hypothetical protein
MAREAASWRIPATDTGRPEVMGGFRLAVFGLAALALGAEETWELSLALSGLRHGRMFRPRYVAA